MPMDILGAVAVEVADLQAARMRAEVDAAGPGAVLDQPRVGVAGRRVIPRDVAGAGRSLFSSAATKADPMRAA